MTEKQKIGHAFKEGWIGGYYPPGYICDECGKETNFAMKKRKEDGEFVEICSSCFNKVLETIEGHQ